jgi:TRAP-type C4-dicarboxylate transport system permease small subunit
MSINGYIFLLPKEIKVLIGVFVVVLSIGFFSGLMFVGETSSANPNGIEEQYLGNEHDEDAEVMKFKKSEKEMLSLVHSHVLSMSVIFFLLALIVSITKLKKQLKMFLMVEPLVSVVLTFGGLYFLWTGILWMKYIVMVSGTLMTFSFLLSVVIILKQLLQKK